MVRIASFYYYKKNMISKWKTFSDWANIQNQNVPLFYVFLEFFFEVNFIEKDLKRKVFSQCRSYRLYKKINMQIKTKTRALFCPKMLVLWNTKVFTEKKVITNPHICQIVAFSRLLIIKKDLAKVFSIAVRYFVLHRI